MSRSVTTPPLQTIFLHIGTEKTGTSSVQCAATMNRERLKARGLLYPAFDDAWNHIHLAAFVANPDRNAPLRRELGLASDADFAAFRDSFRANLLTQIESSGASAMLLSSEHLSSRITRPSELRRLREFLRPFTRDIRVVCYLRPQHEMVVSAYSTKIKAGSDQAFALPDSADSIFLNYEKMLAAWAAEFSESAMTVRLFDRTAFGPSGVIGDLFSVIGIPVDDGFTLPEPQNESLDADTLQFLRILNRHIPRFVDSQPNPDRVGLVSLLEKISVGPRMRLAPEDALRIERMFAPSNDAVARRYLHRDGPLFPPPSLEAPPLPEPLSVERAIALAAKLWCLQRQHASFGKSRPASSPENSGERSA